MRIDVLNQLWAQEHPGGEVEHSGRGGFRVTYRAGGQVYSFAASSVFALAERLDVIPEIDIVAAAGEVVRQLASGEDSVIAPLGAGDTARVLWYERGHDDGERVIDCVLAGVDEYERALGEYSLVDKGGW